MIRFDTHIHTMPFSTDSEQRINEVMTENARSKYGYVLTEHMEYDYPKEGCFLFDCKEYFKQYGPYRGEGLLLGVEMGLTSTNLSKVKNTVNEYPFDMVIGSVHCVGDEDVAYKEYSERYSKKEGYLRYLASIQECVEKYSEIDTIGHIDYICRYSKYADPELYVSDFLDPLTAIYRYAISHDICVEINTRRLGQEAGFKTAYELMRLYSHLGGKYVTVGSDAHYTKNLSMNFDKAEKIIEDNNLIPVYFKERKMVI